MSDWGACVQALDAGGLDLAVERVFGAETVWHAEIDKAASKVLAHRWPGVPNLGDISQVDWAAVEPVDILAAGFPCQDVSAAGKRAGIKHGTRSGLWIEVARAVEALQPRIVVVENVRGLLNAEAHRAVESADTVVGNGPGRPVLRAAGAVLGDLADLGYDAVWATVAASDVGAPHRRERVFIVAVADGAAVGMFSAGPSSEEAWAATGYGFGDCGGERATRNGWTASDTDSARRWQRIQSREASDADRGGSREARQTIWPNAVSSRSDVADPECVGCDCGISGSAVAGVQASGPCDSVGAAAADCPRSDGPLLPTPRSQDGNGYQQRPDADVGNNGRTVSLADRVTRLAGPVELLPTPSASDGSGGKTSRSGDRINEPLLGGIANLLPTPQAHDAQGSKTPGQIEIMRANGHGVRNLNETAVNELLSTPQARDSKGVPRDDYNQACLPRDIIECGSAWGKYEAAVRRWEAVTRPAPPPTIPGAAGLKRPRLNPAFSEWMMGWPDGWVTQVPDISRNDQLRIIGNGVVVAQCVAALRWLLSIETTA